MSRKEAAVADEAEILANARFYLAHVRRESLADPIERWALIHNLMNTARELRVGGITDVLGAMSSALGLRLEELGARELLADIVGSDNTGGLVGSALAALAAKNAAESESALVADAETAGPDADQGDTALTALTAQRQYPDPVAEVAFHGPLGDLVRAIEPHTEADPVALLIQGLVLFGNVIGRGPYFLAESDRHHGNLCAPAKPARCSE